MLPGPLETIFNGQIIIYVFLTQFQRISLWKCIRVLHMALYEATSVKTEAYVVVS